VHGSKVLARDPTEIRHRKTAEKPDVASAACCIAREPASKHAHLHDEHVAGSASWTRERLRRDDRAVREFRAPIRSSVVRTVLAIVLSLIVPVPMVGLLAIVSGMSPASYTIGDGALVVESGDFFSGRRRVSLDDVTDARLVTLHGGRRKAGTSLPGFCAGRFTYPDLGAVWQVTNCGARAVLVQARGEERPIVISPPDPEAFLDRLRSGQATQVTLPPPDTILLKTLGYMLVLVAIVGPLAVSALLLFGPSRMRYLVGSGTLEVKTLFGTKRWPTRGARAKGHTPSKLWRVGGTAVPGYYTGLYRESGQTTRVYATDVRRVVLFEGPARVILSPEDRVAFLRALEEEGVTVEHHA
jgi:hypothetical protein